MSVLFSRTNTGLALVLALAGCSDPVNLVVHANGANATAIQNGQVEILGEGLKQAFDSSGRVDLETLRFSGWRGIKITADGYETMFRTIQFQSGTTHELDVQLRVAPAVHHVTLPTTTPLDVVEGMATVTIPVNGLVHADGSVVTGDVDVLIIPYDPTTKEDAPAPLETEDGHRLISLGMSTITITQGTEELQPAPSTPLGWSMAVNPALTPMADPAYYRLFSVDQNKGVWVPEPKATLTYDKPNSRFTAQLPHLSVWNCDYAWLAGACITGQVKDAHNQVVTDPGISIVANDTSEGVSVDGVMPGFSISSNLGMSSPQYLGNLFIGSFTDPFYVNYGANLPPGYYDDRWAGGREVGRNNVAENGFGVARQALDTSVQGVNPVAINLAPGAYYIPVPAITPDFQWLIPKYGLDELPIQIDLQNVNLTNQHLYQVTKNGQLQAPSTTQGPLTPAHWTCDTVDFQYCYTDGTACQQGDVCCNGNGCGADGTCGGSSCKNVGIACSSSSECCGGQPCNSTGHCGAEPNVCKSTGQGCGNVTDCCSGIPYCLNGSCATCLPTNFAGCSSSSDCCTGSCVGGTCLDCADIGQGCNGNGSCCAGNLCVTPAPNQPASSPDATCQSCIPVGHGTCSGNGDCCDGATCEGGVCRTCAATGGGCGSTADCCGGFCLQNLCATCVPAEQSCSAGPCCAGTQCAFDNKCRACANQGAACTNAIDCCSGNCQDHLCL